MDGTKAKSFEDWAAQKLHEHERIINAQKGPTPQKHTGQGVTIEDVKWSVNVDKDIRIVYTNPLVAYFGKQNTVQARALITRMKESEPYLQGMAVTAA
eukprot:1245400-Rhodomonas_salina.1